MSFQQKNPDEDYYIGKIIGQGSTSVVKECYKKEEPKHKYAVKVLEKSTFQKREWYHLSNEITILKGLKHDNIISLGEIYETNQSLFIFMEYVNGGELFEEVGVKGPLSEAGSSRVIYQIADALDYLHSHCITHRDLKLENILVCKDSTSDDIRIKLSDFGLSKKMKLSDTEMMKTRCGTPAYVAPEIILAQEYSNKVDVWSLGVIMFVMIYCKYPFNGDSLSQIFDNIMSGKLDFPSESIQTSQEAQHLLRELLEVNPEKRPCAKDVLQHPWIQSNISPINS